MINQAWLTTFCTLVEVGHFTKTADKLFMTQSGVSQHIKKLEQQLATPLLIREGKSFDLTDAGKKLYQQGQAVLRSLNELAQSVRQDSPHQGVIRITSPGSIGLQLYPHLLHIQQQHPQLVIDYAFAPNQDIESKLSARQYDIGLMTELSKSEHIVSQQIASEPLVLVTPAAIDQVDWPILLTLGFIAHPDGHYHAQLLLSQNYPQFEHVSQFPHRGFVNQISLICEPVSCGLGFTVLPLHAAQGFRAQELIRIHSLPTAVHEHLYFCINNLALQTARGQYIKSIIMDYLAPHTLTSDA